MAHFARLNETNIVTSVLVINNDCCLDSDGNESEAVGIAFCQSLYGTDSTWVQTSYSGRIRGKYAGVGDTYNAELDEFIAPPPDLTPILPEETT